MKQTAKVVNENGRLMAEVLRPEACEACKACKYGRQARHLVKLPPGDYREGDMVELTLEDGNVGRASILAYGLPLLGLLSGLGLGTLIGGSELSQALGALIMLAVSYGALRLLEPRLRKSGAFTPEISPCARAEQRQAGSNSDEDKA